MTLVAGGEAGETAWVVYEAATVRKRFRNVELLAVRAGRIVRTEVYFGWNPPHPARPGGFVENDGAGRAGA